MKLICLGSSSSGNGYILDGTSEILLIEAGMPLSMVRKECSDFRKIVGCVVTHRHCDHSKYIDDYIKAGIKVYANKDVVLHTTGRYGSCIEIEAFKVFAVGQFIVEPFPAIHDVPCMSFAIKHVEMGTLLFVTDSFGLGATVSPVDHVMIECNWSKNCIDKAIEEGRTKRFVAERSMHTHMSIDQCIHELVEYDYGSLSARAKEVILLHLSHENSDPQLFIQSVEKAVNKPVYVAENGLKIELNNGNLRLDKE